MSYDISLVDPVTKKVLEVDTLHHMRGGTYQVGGTIEAHLNVTFNYSADFRKAFGDSEIKLTEFQKIFGGGVTGIRRIYGLSGVDSIPVLEKAISLLGDDVDDNYWKVTEGNAKRALMQLIALAKMRPDGIWQGD